MYHYNYYYTSDTFCQNAEYIRHNRKLNIIFNFRFHMYDKKSKSVTSHDLDSSLCHKLSHLRPSSPSRVTCFVDGPIVVQRLSVVTKMIGLDLLLYPDLGLASSDYGRQWRSYGNFRAII